jgi:hypothetical protein
MTKDQEYQITECAREMEHGATPADLRAKGYAVGAIREAILRINAQRKEPQP